MDNVSIDPAWATLGTAIIGAITAYTTRKTSARREKFAREKIIHVDMSDVELTENAHDQNFIKAIQDLYQEKNELRKQNELLRQENLALKAQMREETTNGNKHD